MLAHHNFTLILKIRSQHNIFSIFKLEWINVPSKYAVVPLSHSSCFKNMSNADILSISPSPATHNSPIKPIRTMKCRNKSINYPKSNSSKPSLAKKSQLRFTGRASAKANMIWTKPRTHRKSPLSSQIRETIFKTLRILIKLLKNRVLTKREVVPRYHQANHSDCLN